MTYNLTGQTFGRLRVLGRHGSNHAKKATWLCVCSCGNHHIAISEYLRNGDTKSCGCLRRDTGIRIGKMHIGRVLTDEHREAIRRGVANSEKWRAGMASPARGEKIRRSRLGKKHSEETKRKIGLTSKGREWPEASRLKVGERVRGSNHHNWKGGITPELHALRNSPEYANWRLSVFQRDDWTCQHCDRRGNGTLHAHHIKFFKDYPELRMDVDNGMTLCEKCHRKAHRKDKDVD